MIDWKKRYSVQLNALAVVASIAVALIQYLQDADPSAPLATLVLGAITLVLAKVKQS